MCWARTVEAQRCAPMNTAESLGVNNQGKPQAAMDVDSFGNGAVYTWDRTAISSKRYHHWGFTGGSPLFNNKKEVVG